jgi:eukaryotic-like serine/threonine-protein kinase
LISTIIVAREHAGAVKAYQGELKQRAAADESFRQARQAVDTFLALGEEELAGRPPLYQLRRKFLAAALTYYYDFLEQRRDDPAVRDELAATSRSVARIVEELTALERFSALLLLANRHVQDDLDLSASQRETLAAQLAAIGADEQGDPELLLVREGNFLEQVKKLDGQVAAVLDARQMKRLAQLDLRTRGPFAFKSPEVVKELNLTAEQRKKINSIIEEEAPHRRPDRGPPPPRPPEHGGFGPERGFGGPKGRGKGPPPPRYGGGREPKGPKGDRPPPPNLRAAIERTIPRIVALLDADQQAKWNELIGPPFEHDLPWRLE